MESRRLTHRAAFLVAVILVCATFVRPSRGHTQYHEQGLYGAKSYKFGYATEDAENPMERHETSDAHGHVKGWYSFRDSFGKNQVIHYEAHPKLGFRVFSHKSIKSKKGRYSRKS